MDRNGTSGKLAVYGSAIAVALALVGGIYSLGQNQAEIRSEVRAVTLQMHAALQTGEEKIDRLQDDLQIGLDRNCRILAQLDQDIRLHAAADSATDFPPFPDVSC